MDQKRTKDQVLELAFGMARHSSAPRAGAAVAGTQAASRRRCWLLLPGAQTLLWGIQSGPTSTGALQSAPPQDSRKRGSPHK